MKKALRGAFKLANSILERERLYISVWLVAVAVTCAATIVSYAELFKSQADILAMGLILQNPAIVTMFGPVYDTGTIGGVFAASMFTFLAVAIGIMNIFLVARNTRGDEERGCIELLRALPTGRPAHLCAVLFAAIISNLLMSLFVGLAVSVMNVNGITIGSSMLFGFSLGAIGLFFAMSSAVIAQLFSSTRSTTGFCFAFLGFLYILRATGDSSMEAVSLISPLGLILRTQCFVRDFWWPVLIVLIITLCFAVLAFWLATIRDLGQGLLPQKEGRKEASKLLHSHQGLALKLTLGTAIAWAAGLFIIGVAYGSIMGDIESFIDNNEFFKTTLTPPPGHTQTEMLITMIVSLFAVASAIPAAGSVLKLCGEETHKRYENINSKSLSRARILTSYLIIGLTVSVLMLLCSLIGFWLMSAAVMTKPIAFDSMFKSVAVYLPAVLVIVGLAVLLSGLFPEKASAVIYGYLGLSFFTDYFGALLKFPDWMQYTNPYGFIPKLPMDDINYLTLFLLVVASAVLIAAGYIFYRRRDLKG